MSDCVFCSCISTLMTSSGSFWVLEHVPLVDRSLVVSRMMNVICCYFSATCFCCFSESCQLLQWSSLIVSSRQARLFSSALCRSRHPSALRPDCSHQLTCVTRILSHQSHFLNSRLLEQSRVCGSVCVVCVFSFL